MIRIVILLAGYLMFSFFLEKGERSSVSNKETTELKKEPDKLVLALYSRRNKERGIHIAEVNIQKKEERLMVLDTSMYGKRKPLDFFFLSKTKAIYHGKFLTTFNIHEKSYSRISTMNNLSESFLAKDLSNSFVISDSADITYFKEYPESYKLYLNDSVDLQNSGELLLSMNSFVKAKNIRANKIYYPFYTNINSNFSQYDIYLIDISINENKVEIFDTINYSRLDNPLIYFNPRNVQVDDGNLSYMKIFKLQQDTTDYKIIKIYTYNSNLKKLNVRYDFTLLDSSFQTKSDMYDFFIWNDSLFLATDHEVFICMNNQIRSIYRNTSFEIMDFYLE